MLLHSHFLLQLSFLGYLEPLLFAGERLVFNRVFPELCDPLVHLPDFLVVSRDLPLLEREVLPSVHLAFFGRLLLGEGELDVLLQNLQDDARPGPLLVVRGNELQDRREEQRGQDGLPLRRAAAQLLQIRLRELPERAAQQRVAQLEHVRLPRYLLQGAAGNLRRGGVDQLLLAKLLQKRLRKHQRRTEQDLLLVPVKVNV